MEAVAHVACLHCYGSPTHLNSVLMNAGDFEAEESDGVGAGAEDDGDCSWEPD